jgi:hypothetical protein
MKNKDESEMENEENSEMENEDESGLDHLKRENAELRQQLDSEKERYHQAEIFRRDTIIKNLQERLDVLSSTPSNTETELGVLADIIKHTHMSIDDSVQQIKSLLKDDKAKSSTEPYPGAKEIKNGTLPLPKIAEDFFYALWKYRYTEDQAKLITEHILTVAGEEGFRSISRLEEFLNLFPSMGNPSVHKALLQYWAAKNKLMRS